MYNGVKHYFPELASLSIQGSLYYALLEIEHNGSLKEITKLARPVFKTEAAALFLRLCGMLRYICKSTRST